MSIEPASVYLEMSRPAPFRRAGGSREPAR